MVGVLSNADEACLELTALMQLVEASWRGSNVTEKQKRAARLRYRRLKMRLKRGSLMQQVGIRLVRTARCDKNLLTMMKAFVAEQEEDAAALRSAEQMLALLSRGEEGKVA